jgi:hypothetical protein
MGNGFSSGRRVYSLIHDLPRIAGRRVQQGCAILTSALFSRFVAEFNFYGIFIFDFLSALFSNHLLRRTTYILDKEHKSAPHLFE